MRHIRIDNQALNSHRRFACGIGPTLPEGDTYVFACEGGLMHTVDCPGCRPAQEPLGVPLSELSGRPGHKGFERFAAIARSWGYD